MSRAFTPRLHCWRNDDHGGVAVIFAVLLLPLMTLVGLVLDYADTTREREKLHSALASAASMLAKETDIDRLSPALAGQRARAYVSGANERLDLSAIKLKVSVSPRQVILGASKEMALPFGALVGTPSRTVKVSVTAPRDDSRSSDAEVRDDEKRPEPDVAPIPMPFQMLQPPGGSAFLLPQEFRTTENLR